MTTDTPRLVLPVSETMVHAIQYVHADAPA